MIAVMQTSQKKTKALGSLHIYLSTCILPKRQCLTELATLPTMALHFITIFTVSTTLFTLYVTFFDGTAYYATCPHINQQLHNTHHIWLHLNTFDKILQKFSTTCTFSITLFTISMPLFDIHRLHISFFTRHTLESRHHFPPFHYIFS